MRKPRVYISMRDPRFRYEDALNFGSEVVPLLNQEIDLAFGLDRSKKQIESKLLDFDPDIDYMIVTADPVCTFLLGRMSAKFKSINLLKWDNRSFRYYPVVIK